MDDEKLEKANALKEEIKNTKENLSYFKCLADNIKTSGENIKICRSAGYNSVEVPESIREMIMFQVENATKSELKKLETKFENL